jgi:hypothetical protein
MTTRRGILKSALAAAFAPLLAKLPKAALPVKEKSTMLSDVHYTTGCSYSPTAVCTLGTLKVNDSVLVYVWNDAGGISVRNIKLSHPA